MRLVQTVETNPDPQGRLDLLVSTATEMRMKKLALMQALSVLALAGLAGAGPAVGEPEPRTKPHKKRAYDNDRLTAANNKRAKKAAKRARIAARDASANA